MRVLVSACLLGRNCKYSGGNNRNEKVLAFLQGKEVVPVCPEVEAGLPVPRRLWRSERAGWSVKMAGTWMKSTAWA